MEGRTEGAHGGEGRGKVIPAQAGAPWGSGRWDTLPKAGPGWCQRRGVKGKAALIFFISLV